jgi:hypothetical protein
MKFEAESKFDIGQWVKVGSIAVKIQAIEYWPNKGFSYRVNESTPKCRNHVVNWYDEDELKFIAVTEIPQ